VSAPAPRLVTADTPLDRVATIRTPPHSEEAERALLAAILGSPSIIDAVRQVVVAEDFYILKHARVFDACCTVSDNAGAPDAVAVLTMLAEWGDLVPFGGSDYLRDLAATYTDATNATSYAATIRDHAKRRAIIAAAVDASRAAYDGAAPGDIIESTRGALTSMERKGAPKADTVASLLQSAFEDIDSPVARTGIPTGYQQIDSLMGGMEAGQMIVVGGRTSMGKTALALNIAARVAMVGTPVGYVTMEMSKSQLIRRILASEAKVNPKRLRGGRFVTDEERARLETTRHRLKSMPLIIDDVSSPSPEQLRSRARTMLERHRIGLLVVDHLHLMRAPERDKTIRSSTDRMTAISGSIKALAKDLGIPVVALAQLNREAAKANREVTTKKRKRWNEDGPDIARPTLTDLRDSGALEQDADVVALVHREGYYTKDPSDHRAEVIIAKNRDGETGVACLGWEDGYQRFVDIDPSQGGAA
jgi:replicative DNA helicase